MRAGTSDPVAPRAPGAADGARIRERRGVEATAGNAPVRLTGAASLRRRPHSGEVPITKPTAGALWEGAIAEPAAELRERPASIAQAGQSVPARSGPSSRARARVPSRRLALGGLQVLVLAVSALAIWLLLGKVDVAAALGAAGRLSWRVVALVVLLNVPTTLLRALRSQLLMRRLGHRVPYWRMTGVDLAGQTLSWITPAAAGDLSRPYMWRNRDRVPVSAGVAVVIYERLVTMMQLGVVGGVLAAALYLPAAGVVAVAVGGLVALAAPWWLSRGARRWAPTGGTGRRGPIGGLLRSLRQLESLGLSPRLTTLFAICTLAVFALSGLQVGLLAWGIGAGVSLGVAIAAYCLSQVAGSVSTLPFGIGAADVVTIALLVAGGMARVDAVAVTVLLRLLLTLPLGLAGAGGILVLGRPRIAPDEAGTGAPAT